MAFKRSGVRSSLAPQKLFFELQTVVRKFITTILKFTAGSIPFYGEIKSLPGPE